MKCYIIYTGNPVKMFHIAHVKIKKKSSFLIRFPWITETLTDYIH